MWIGEAKSWGAVGDAERRRRLGHANGWSSARQAARKVVRREQDSGAQGKGKRNRKRGQGDAKTRKEPTPNNGKLRWPGSVWGEGEMRRASEQELPKRPECTAGRALAGTAVPSLTAPLACTDDSDWGPQIRRGHRWLAILRAGSSLLAAGCWLSSWPACAVGP
jgi:hypothetical protein